MVWTVYIIGCYDGTLYTGVTNELKRRFQEHLNHPRGAKYFNGCKPLEVVYSEKDHTRSSACQREAAIKKLNREEKLPETGFQVIALPMKIRDGSGGPLRIVAVLP